MSEEYINFTEEQKHKAHKADLVEYLRRRGEKLVRTGKEFRWEYNKEKVSIKGSVWYNYYTCEGGDAVKFLRTFFGMTYAEAVQSLLEGSGEVISAAETRQAERKPFTIPRKNDNMRRVYGYLLNKRKIDIEVLNEFVRNKLIYESADYHNAVFVGRDPDGMIRHIHKRGTYSENAYKGNASGSMPEYSFHWIGKSNRIYLFEAPIDMLSFISMYKEHWQEHTYAAACSVSEKVLMQCLLDNPKLTEVYLCLDNDEAGQAANGRIAGHLQEMGIQAKILVPENKDWNEDIVTQSSSIKMKVTL